MKKIIVMLLVVSFLGGLLPALGARAEAASAAIAAAHHAGVATGSAATLRGARLCFGIGSNNCCGEFTVIGALAGCMGNVAAVAVAVAGYYVYCS